MYDATTKLNIYNLKSIHTHDMDCLWFSFPLTRTAPKEGLLLPLGRFLLERVQVK